MRFVVHVYNSYAHAHLVISMYTVCVLGPFYSGKGINKHVLVDETFTEIFH